MTDSRHLMKPRFALAPCSPLLLLLAVCLPAAAEDKWAFDVTPYLWVAGVDAETSLATPLSYLPPEPGRRNTPPVVKGDLPPLPPAPSMPAEATRFDTRISAGFMLAAQAHYQSVGVFVDFAWLRLDSDASDPSPAFSSGHVKSDFIHSTLALTYRLPLEGKFHAELLAGARLWNVNEDLSYQSGTLQGFNVSGDKTWVDPVIGADLRYDLSKRWSLLVKGTSGGAGSGLGYDVVGGVGYRFCDWCSAAVGYRYLHEDYSQNGFKLDANLNGFILGVGFHF